MSARFSVNEGNTGGHRPPLQVLIHARSFEIPALHNRHLTRIDVPAERGIDLIQRQCAKLRIQLFFPGQRAAPLLASRDDVEQTLIAGAASDSVIEIRLSL